MMSNSDPAGRRSDDRRQTRSTPDELAALARLGSDQPLTDTDIAALDRLDHGPDGPKIDPEIDPDDFDPDCAPPEWWLAMSGEQKAWLDDPEPVPAQPDVLDAGLTHRGGSGGIGFAAAGCWTGWTPARPRPCARGGSGIGAWACCPTASWRG